MRINERKSHSKIFETFNIPLIPALKNTPLAINWDRPSINAPRSSIRLNNRTQNGTGQVPVQSYADIVRLKSTPGRRCNEQSARSSPENTAQLAIPNEGGERSNVQYYPPNDKTNDRENLQSPILGDIKRTGRPGASNVGSASGKRTKGASPYRTNRSRRSERIKEKSKHKMTLRKRH
jgi:hypothetical protein